MKHSWILAVAMLVGCASSGADPVQFAENEGNLATLHDWSTANPKTHIFVHTDRGDRFFYWSHERERYECGEDHIMPRADGKVEYRYRGRLIVDARR